MDSKYDQNVIDQYQIKPELDMYYFQRELLPPQFMGKLDFPSLEHVKSTLEEQRAIAKNNGAINLVKTEDLYCFHVTRFFPGEIIRPRQYAHILEDVRKKAEADRVTKKVRNVLCKLPQAIDSQLAKALNIDCINKDIDIITAHFLATSIGIWAIQAEYREVIENVDAMSAPQHFSWRLP